MSIGQLWPPRAPRLPAGASHCPDSDTVTPEWIDRLAEEAIDDLVPCSIEPAFLRLRLEAVLRNYRRSRELELLREAARSTLRWTGSPASTTAKPCCRFSFARPTRAAHEEFPVRNPLRHRRLRHWNLRLGPDACDELLCHVVRAPRACCAVTTCWAAPAATSS